MDCPLQMESARNWQPEPLLRLLTWLFASMFAGGIFMAAIPKLAGGGVTPQMPEIRFIAFLVGACSFHGAVILLALEFVRAQHSNWREAFGIGSFPTKKVLLYASLATVASLPTTWILTNFSGWVMTLLNMEPDTQVAVKTLQSTKGVLERIVLAASAILLAPVAEELLFRGILYPAIRALNLPRVALWGTSILFAAVHSNLLTFLPLTVLALILAWLYEKTRDLRVPILTHSLFNLVNFIWLLLQ